LSNFQLECILGNEKNFAGVFASDTLPKKIKPAENGLVNLEKISSSGTHWVAYYNSPSSPNVEYFDSFGLVPSNRILKYLQTSGKPVIYNDRQLQANDSLRCGFYCVHFIQQRNRQKSYHQVLKAFIQKPSLYNENQVLMII